MLCIVCVHGGYFKKQDYRVSWITVLSKSFFISFIRFGKVLGFTQCSYPARCEVCVRASQAEVTRVVVYVCTCVRASQAEVTHVVVYVCSGVAGGANSRCCVRVFGRRRRR